MMKQIQAKKVLTLVIAVILVGILVRIFFLDTYIVRGNSMEPTILSGEYVLVNKRAYGKHREPQRGDVVVTRFREEGSPTILKRVIGLPGERLEIEPGKITIKSNREDVGETLLESYVLFPEFELNGVTTIVLDPKEYFLLGDNRLASIDSRTFGPVDSWDLYGKVLLAINFRKHGLTRF